MTKWHFTERGEGRPLVLLHGIGMSGRAWNPVVPILAQQRRVIVFDTAGFGHSPRLPENIPPTTINLVLSLAENLRTLGFDEPIDIAGNSLGGWMALEAAKQGLARSVVAISPAGLWQHPPAHAKHVFFAMRRITQLAPSMVSFLLGLSWMREILLAMPLTIGCRKMPAKEAINAAFDFANAPGFVDTFLQADRFRNGHEITVPLTVAFGTHDWLLAKQAQRRDDLPATVSWLSPVGWGHVPMWKDPTGVAELILKGTR